MTRRTPALAALLATALVAVGAAVLPGTSARAATSCPGKLIYSKGLMFKKKKIGELDVYWAAATKMNCAIFNHAGPSWGKKVKTAVQLGRCPKSAKKPGDECVIYGGKDWRQDYDKYAYRAGPVKLKARHCIFVAGGIVWGKHHYMHWVDPHGRTGAGFCRS
jgi:hypothetical protein